MPELMGLLACICMSAYTAGYALRETEGYLDSGLFRCLVSILVGLAMLLVTSIALYGVVRMLNAVFGVVCNLYIR
jgi:hypothetical protein